MARYSIEENTRLIELANEACELLQQQTEFLRVYSLGQLDAGQRMEYLRRQERIRELVKIMVACPPRIIPIGMNQRVAESL